MSINSINRSNSYYTFLILFLVALSGLPIDIYVPSLPEITNVLHCSKSAAQISVTLYLLCFGISQIFFGYISDNYGRKKCIVWGCLLTSVLFVLITFSKSIFIFNLLRMMQGVTTSCFITSIRALLKDRFEGLQYKKMVNLFLLTWTVSPIFAPTVGGYLQHHFGWQASFYLLSIHSLIGGVVACYMNKENVTKTSEKIIQPLQRLLKSPKVIMPSIQCAIAFSILTIINTYTPFIIQKDLHLSAIVNGYVSSAYGIMWVLGNVINQKLLSFSAHKVLSYVMLYLIVIVITSLIVIGNDTVTIKEIVLPLIMILPCFSIVYSTNYSVPMASHPKNTALAGAIIGSSVGFGAGVIGSIASFHYIDQGIKTILWIILLAVILMYFTVRSLNRSNK